MQKLESDTNFGTFLGSAQKPKLIFLFCLAGKNTSNYSELYSKIMASFVYSAP